MLHVSRSEKTQDDFQAFVAATSKSSRTLAQAREAFLQVEEHAPSEQIGEIRAAVADWFNATPQSVSALAALKVLADGPADECLLRAELMRDIARECADRKGNPLREFEQALPQLDAPLSKGCGQFGRLHAALAAREQKAPTIEVLCALRAYASESGRTLDEVLARYVVLIDAGCASDEGLAVLSTFGDEPHESGLAAFEELKRALMVRVPDTDAAALLLELRGVARHNRRTQTEVMERFNATIQQGCSVEENLSLLRMGLSRRADEDVRVQHDGGHVVIGGIRVPRSRANN